jgi:hypothetical protein
MTTTTSTNAATVANPNGIHHHLLILTTFLGWFMFALQLAQKASCSPTGLPHLMHCPGLLMSYGLCQPNLSLDTAGCPVTMGLKGVGNLAPTADTHQD